MFKKSLRLNNIGHCTPYEHATCNVFTPLSGLKVYYGRNSFVPLTISEIAKLVGVSMANVSLVLKNSIPLKSKTKQKVLKTLEEQAYIHYPQ